MELPDEKIKDFAVKVEPVYQLLNWKWHKTDGSMCVPTTEEIEKEIKKLIKELMAKDDYTTSISCGGLFVHRYEPDGDTFYEFGLEIAESFYI